MKLLIRKATHEDASGLSELFVELVGEQSDIGALKKQLLFVDTQPNYYVAVACLDNKVVGTAMGIVCVDLVGNCAPFLLIENVVVSSKCQKLGIGKKLMTELENFAIQHHCNFILLASSHEREEAHRFYESLGYKDKKKGFFKQLS
ncbi:GNAT family N-acetyltransferase [Paenibacillus puldeungensis]|uniref:GNAT family N-acetyltransferase n=1 Tax=Paenibacillus puldeungensis TaxID=696536 RepID=A0ABW3S0F0_9BACL